GDHRRRQAGAFEDLEDHGDDRRLAAGARDGDALVLGHVPRQLVGAVRELEAERARAVEVLIVLLDGRRGDGIGVRAVERAAVLREDPDAEGLELLAQLGRAARVERAVGAGRRPAAHHVELGEGADPEAGGADEVDLLSLWHGGQYSRPSPPLPDMTESSKVRDTAAIPSGGLRVTELTHGNFAGHPHRLARAGARAAGATRRGVLRARAGLHRDRPD